MLPNAKAGAQHGAGRIVVEDSGQRKGFTVIPGHARKRVNPESSGEYQLVVGFRVRASRAPE
jgi:hypothetical protein